MLNQLLNSIEIYDLEKFKQIIETNIFDDSDLYTALEYLIESENINMIKILLSKFKSPNILEKKFVELCYNTKEPEILYLMQKYIQPCTISQLARNPNTYIVDLIEEDKNTKLIKILNKMDLSNPVKKLKLQMQINDHLIEALYSSHLFVANRLISGYYMLKPSNQVIDQVFNKSIRKNNFKLAYILCNYKPDKSIVTVQMVNNAFIDAVDEYNILGVHWLLENKIIIPDMNLIDSVYFDYCIYLYNNSMEKSNAEMRELIEKYVEFTTINRVKKYIRCLEDRKTRVGNIFRTHIPTEIHSYSASKIHHKKNLNLTVLEAIKKKIQGKQTLTESEILIFLTDTIRHYVSIELQSKALDRVGELLDSSTVELFGTVIVYLKNFDSSHIEIWIKGFIEESINANSCTAGALERIVTGLRGISDPEISNIFAEAEGPQLYKIFLKEGLNIFSQEPKYQTNHKRIINLIKSELGNNPCSEELVRQILESYVKTNIESFGLDLEKYFEEAIPVIDIIVDSYDTHIINYL